MAERKMTEKGFIRKATSSKVSAAAFIAQHREWLLTGTLASLTSPIIAKLDSGETLPTPALTEINNVVLAHMVAKEIVKGQIAAAAEPEKTTKPYTAVVYDDTGKVATQKTEKGMKDLESNFDANIRATEWCDRRLAEGGPGWFAIVTCNASGRTEKVERDQSLGRLYGHKVAGPAMKKQGSRGGPWGMKVKGDHFHFSRG